MTKIKILLIFALVAYLSWPDCQNLTLFGPLGVMIASTLIAFLANQLIYRDYQENDLVNQLNARNAEKTIIIAILSIITFFSMIAFVDLYRKVVKLESEIHQVPQR